MKTQIIAVSILAGLVFSARATIITHDPYSMAQNAVHEVINIVKYAGTQIKTTETALNTLRTYEQQVVQLARLGNPAALRALPGVSTVAELYGTGQQLMYNYQSWQQYLNPQRYQGDMNYILSSYRQPNWQGYSTYSGYNVAPSQGLYQFDTARYNIAQAGSDELKQLEQQRQRLEQQRDVAMQSLQSASTDAQVKKYHGVLDGLNGALAEIGARANEVAHRVAIKAQQINAGQQVYSASQAEQRAAAAYKGIDTDLQALPADNFREMHLWSGR